MALSTCGKCGSRLFEVNIETPLSSNFKLCFVQCSSCGNVVGVMDYVNIGAKLEELGGEVKKLKQQQQATSSLLQTMAGTHDHNFKVLDRKISAILDQRK